MVRQARAKRPREQSVPRPSPTNSISKVAALQRKPNRAQALELIHAVAVAVAPIMHKHGFKVGLLCEMFPKDARLLGLNVNRGQRVCLRLRYASDETQFLPMGDVIYTMLHELSHNVHGPHNHQFYSLLEELKQEFEQMQLRGAYAATGAFSESNRLGGRAGAPSRLLTLYTRELRRLGSSTGAQSQLPLSLAARRQLVLDALSRRLQDSGWCHGDQPSASQTEEAPDECELEVVVVEDEPEVVVVDSDDEPSKRPTVTKPHTVIDLTYDE